MGRLNDTKEFINMIAPKWSTTSTKIRGIPLYVDPLLSGMSRFSRKTGTIGLINPDIEIFLSQKAQQNQNKIRVNRFNNWFSVGSVIALNSLEKFTIKAIDNLDFILNANIKVPQDTKSPVTLYSVPIISVNNYSRDVKTIQIRSKHQMMIGDVLAFSVYENIYIENEIVDLKDLGETSNPYNFTYEVTLKEGIPYNLDIDQVIQLRAFPAYFSKVLKIPANPLSGKPIGPFVVDHFSGKIVNGKSPEVFFSIQCYDLLSQKVLSPEAMSVKKNHAIFARDWDFSTPMFWDRMTGEFKLGENKVIAVCDEDGKFGVSYDAQPNFKPGSTWKVLVTSKSDAVVRIGFEPNKFKTYNLRAGEVTPLIVGEDILEDAKKITITASSVPLGEIEFSTWQLRELEVSRISYSILGRVEKEAIWLSSGLIVKPLFLTLDYITTTYDSGDVYDAGLIYI